MKREQSPTVLISSDSRLIHLAQASAAASGADLTVTEASDMRLLWRSAPAVLIGADQLDQVVRACPPSRDQVYLVGQPEAYEELCRWSMPLSASVIVVPEGNKWLSRVIAGQRHDARSGLVVAVSGGSGGVGASTLAVSLAVLAVNRSMSVALVDADPTGGGIDLLLGAENQPGWRWDKLRNAVGQITDIAAMLPQVAGITMVSMERLAAMPVSDQALESVVDCLSRTHDLVLIDAGRSARVTSARRSILVSGQTVRSVAAARTGLSAEKDCAVVVRKGGSINPGDVARVLELPLIGVLPSVGELPRLADRGIAPVMSGSWKRACAKVLQWCLAIPGSPQPATNWLDRLRLGSGRAQDSGAGARRL